MDSPSILLGKRFAFLVGCLLTCLVSFANPLKIGEVTLSIGQSALFGRAPALELVQKGELILEGDVIKTSASGHVHIRFVDGALISVRPNSVLAIHQFKYDAINPSNSLVRLSLDAGEVRSISGAAAQAAKDRFRLNTPLAAIGVKGTDFVATIEPQATRVTVNQGAIVMAPFDSNCKVDSLGICSGSRARELSADMTGISLVYRSGSVNPSFQTVPRNTEADKLQPTSRINQGSDRVVTAGDATALLGETAPTPIPSPTLVWGRWNQVPRPGDNLTKDFRSAFAGNDITVGDGYYFLFREIGGVNLLPTLNNQAEFKLNSSSAQYRAPSNEISAARVDAGSFTVNFAQHSFDTRLWISSSGMDPQSLRFSGKIDPNTGFFSDPRSSGQVIKLGGSLSFNGREAGYFFLAPVGNGSLSGATLWRR